LTELPKPKKVTLITYYANCNFLVLQNSMLIKILLSGTLHSISASDMVSQLGLVFGATSPKSRSSLVVGEVMVGDVNPLECS